MKTDHIYTIDMETESFKLKVQYKSCIISTDSNRDFTKIHSD